MIYHKLTFNVTNNKGGSKHEYSHTMEIAYLYKVILVISNTPSR